METDTGQINTGLRDLMNICFLLDSNLMLTDMFVHEHGKSRRGFEERFINLRFDVLEMNFMSEWRVTQSDDGSEVEHVINKEMESKQTLG